MTYILPLIIIGVFLVVYLGYMKFYYPKFKEKYEQADNEINQEWAQNKEAILNEYLDDPNAFGLLRDVTKGEEIIGVLSTTGTPDSLANKAKDAVVGAITRTRKVDMSMYYLIATDKALHYTGFNGDNCFVHEIFDYNQMSDKKMSTNKFSFLYKNETITFPLEGHVLVGYPRFEVLEKDILGSNRFEHKFFAYDYQKALKIGTGVGMASKEHVKDTKIRSYLVEQFKQKLGIHS